MPPNAPQNDLEGSSGIKLCHESRLHGIPLVSGAKPAHQIKDKAYDQYETECSAANGGTAKIKTTSTKEEK